MARIPFPVHLSLACEEVPRHPDTTLIARLTVTDIRYYRAAKALYEARKGWYVARRHFRFGGMIAAELAWEKATAELRATGLADAEALIGAVRRRTDAGWSRAWEPWEE